MNCSVLLVHSAALWNIPSTNAQWLAQLAQLLSPLLARDINNMATESNVIYATQQKVRQCRSTIYCTLGNSTMLVLQLWQLLRNQGMLLPLVQHITATKTQTSDIKQATHYNCHLTHQPYCTVSECIYIESWSVLVSSCQPSAIHNFAGNSELHPP